jgi:microcystin-dependent protein
MSNYTKATNFTAKDGLPAGNSSKVVKGSELDTEFTAIASAISSKADTNSPTFTGTPLAPTAASGTNNTQIATTAFATAAAAAVFPVGGIIMWSGSVASIPSGWALCNGSNGTPDLRNRFVVGAGSTYAVDATGGSADAIVVSHTHTTSASTVSDHQHALIANADTGTSALTTTNQVNYRQQGGSSNLEYFLRGSSTAATLGLSSAAGSHTHSITVNSQGSSGTNANLPPYYALAYIMKL